MKKRGSLGLDVYIGEGAHEGEQRITVRLPVGHEVVAWFRAGTRASDGTSINSGTWQLIHRAGLSDRQVAVIRRWLRKQVLAGLQ